MPDELKKRPRLVGLAEQIWGYYLDLRSQLSSNGFSLNPLTDRLILDWATAPWRRVKLQPYQVRTLYKIHAEYYKAEAKAAKERAARNG